MRSTGDGRRESASGTGGDFPLLSASVCEDVLLIVAPAATAGGEEPAWASGRCFPSAGDQSVDTGGMTVYVASASAETAKVPAPRVELRTLIRERLAIWPPESRRLLLNFLAGLGGELGLSAELSEGLFELREGLRERLPLAADDERLDHFVEARSLSRLDAYRFYLRGRLRAPGEGQASVVAVSPEGEAVPLDFRLEPIGDGEFVCRFETTSPSRRATDWVLELRTELGATESWSAVGTAHVDEIVEQAAVSAPARDRLIADHVRPAVSWLQLTTKDAAEVGSDIAYGERIAKPSASIIVAVGAAVELIEHQLVAFVDDADLSGAELLYVLDGPARQDRAERVARELHELYRRPFRLLTPSATCGRTLATGLGASAAAASRLLFLDAGILPSRHGWLGVLSRFYEATPGIGLVAPKLLCEDEAIAQAGYELRRATDGGPDEWEIRPRYNGLHAGFAAANVARPVPALSLTCALVDTARLQAVGGQEWLYLGRELADADLCLRFAAAGAECWYLPAVEFYDVREPRDASSAARRAYDRWLFSRLRREELAGLGQGTNGSAEAA